jgi:hypothetical protein
VTLNIPAYVWIAIAVALLSGSCAALLIADSYVATASAVSRSVPPRP